jgi:hypothetical protein
LFVLRTTCYNVKCFDIFNQIYIECRHSSVSAADEFEKFQVFMHIYVAFKPATHGRIRLS